jgi:hypothetical protein
MLRNRLRNTGNQDSAAANAQRPFVLRGVLAAYLVGMATDFGYRLVAVYGIVDQRLSWSDGLIAFQASLFWPVDVAIRLIAGT